MALLQGTPGVANGSTHFCMPAEEVDHLLALCQEYDLVPCGGSDFHALKTPDEMAPGTVGPPLESVQRLAGRAGPRGMALALALA